MIPTRNLTQRCALSLVLLLGTGGTNLANASLAIVGLETDRGLIANSRAVLSIQNNGTEQGCVAWNGTSDVIGSGACQGGLSPAVTGGDEKMVSSHTQTTTVASAGLSSGQSLVVILDVNEEDGNFTVANLRLTVYSETGTVLYNSGNLLGAGIPPGGGITITSSARGHSVYAFKLDATQAAAISPFICTSTSALGCSGGASAANATNRIGLGALLTNVRGGTETFSIGNTP